MLNFDLDMGTSNLHGVLIVNPDSIERKGIKQILFENFKNLQSFEAKNGKDCLIFLETANISSVFLDANSDSNMGIHTLKKIKSFNPQIKVVLFSGEITENLIFQAIDSNIDGFIIKDSDTKQIITVMNSILNNEIHFDQESIKYLINLVKTPNQLLPQKQLSRRELAVFNQLIQGKLIKQIAAQLKISPKTVSTYKSRILDKMNCGSNAELASYAVKNNLSF